MQGYHFMRYVGFSVAQNTPGKASKSLKFEPSSNLNRWSSGSGFRKLNEEVFLNSRDNHFLS